MVLTFYRRLFRFVTMHAFDRQTNRKATAIARSNRVKRVLKRLNFFLNLVQCLTAGSL